MGAAAKPAEPGAPPPGRLQRIFKRIWWLHSFFALFFGVGVMLFARAGLAYADKFLVALLLSWSLMFVALRFIVGPANRREGEGVARKGVRVATNYVIKQFYQQMFFFLVPLYASSATWSLSSMNWWLAPLLLVCAVVSTMDLVFDNYIMERRWLASLMYGLAMFGVINVLVPLVFGMTHLTALFIAAAATPPAVALLTFSARSVFGTQGILLTLIGSGGLLGAVWMGRGFIPPAPMALAESAIGHGTFGSRECLPPSKHVVRADELDGLRCGSLVREPGGLKEPVVHHWSHRGRELARVVPDRLRCDGPDDVFRSEFPADKLPADPTGTWACTTRTEGGQLVGVRHLDVIAPPAAAAGSADAGSGSAGSGSADSGSADAGSGGAAS
ncbi:MAG: DUF5924 family protein [Kofleriaceae bacterium]